MEAGQTDFPGSGSVTRPQPQTTELTQPTLQLGAPQEKRPEKNDSIFVVRVSPASHVTRTKSFPPLVLCKTKFSASQRVWNCEFFSQYPPRGIIASAPATARIRAYNRGQERHGTKMRAETHQDKATLFQTALSEKIRAHVGLHRP